VDQGGVKSAAQGWVGRRRSSRSQTGCKDPEKHNHRYLGRKSEITHREPVNVKAQMTAAAKHTIAGVVSITRKRRTES